MNKVGKSPSGGPVIFGVEAYISPDYARAEQDRLWRKVWQEAGRVEEILNVGDYITYDIMDDSILIVRTAADQIKAYHNVCQHRGRRLVDTPQGMRHARGKTKQFVCGFHGWRWDIHGQTTHILDMEDWKGCLTVENTKLPEVRVDTWGGWIFINMDPDCEPLRQFLEPAASMLDPFELEKMRFRWRRWVIFDSNWKTGIEAFLESYHVAGTHPEFLRYADWYSHSFPQGRHSNSGFGPRESGGKTESLVRVGKGDARVMTAELQALNWYGTNAATTQVIFDAAHRLVHELPEGTPAADVMKHWIDSAKRDDAARGVIWPTIDPKYTKSSSWNIFPNFKVIPLPTTAMCYNFRPYGTDPDKCIYEAFVIERFPEGQEPRTEWVYTPVDDPAWSTVLPQDFSNMTAVQQGMKSGGFPGPRPNPVQENGVTNLHRTLAEYMGTGAPRPIT
jgi:phenylpropionate dioxygenase-like ring-hydroxylating dioxygenase large terminal subunit